MKSIPPNAIQTHSGEAFDLWTSGPEAIHLDDIAQSLAMQCRFNGHIRLFYSVAEHCVHVANWLLEQTSNPQLALEGLLHDASEAYLCDIPRPFKRHLTNYKALEQRVERAVAARFRLSYPMDPMIVEADTRILLDEKKTLMLVQIHWPDMDGIEPLGVKLLGLEPLGAKDLFLSTYASLLAKLGVDND